MASHTLRKTAILFLAFIFFIPALPSCGGAERYTATYTDVFDTVTTFTAYCTGREEFDRLSEGVHAELVRLNSLFDIYNENSVISLLNSSGQAVINDDVYQVLSVSRDFYGKTGGKLNIAMGSVLRLWHSFREFERDLPSIEELRSAALHADFGNLIFDREQASIFDPEMTIDLGSVAKGYAAGRAAEKAAHYSFILNVGGNVYAGGLKNGNEKWAVGVENPDGGFLTVLKVSDLSVVTSGDYQRYREHEGVRYHHIIDSDTLYPASSFRSVTVIHPDSLIADALSTSLFCMDIESGLRLAEEYGAEALWLKENGDLVRTDGFSGYEK